jgi:hypothetical protein
VSTSWGTYLQKFSHPTVGSKMPVAKDKTKARQGKRCETCAYCECGECRRFHPQISSGDYVSSTGWPSVKEDDWCGEHLNVTRTR